MKHLITSICIFFCINSNAQSFCAINFGNEWGVYKGCEDDFIVASSLVSEDTSDYTFNDTVYTLPNLDSLFFSHDTITFLRSVFESNYKYINLECSDSTYSFWHHSGISSMNEKQELDTLYITGTSDDRGGIWSIKGSIISFKPQSLNFWFHFRIENIGTKETNKKIIWTSTGDYRTSIRLIRII